VQGHGVHSMYEECIAALTTMNEVRLVRGRGSTRPHVTLHAHTVGPMVLARMVIHRGPRVLTAHVTPGSFIGSIRGMRLLLWAVRRYLRFVYDHADSVLAVSHATAKEVAALGVSTPVRVVHSAIDDSRLRELIHTRPQLRTAFGWGDRPTVLAVGQVQPRKGVAEFIACARALPDLRFVWIGGMPFGLVSAQRGLLMRQIRDVPANCQFRGQMSRSRVFEYYAAADVFFLPSRHETFGLATLEAASAGLPLVLSDLPCYREWLGNAYLSGSTPSHYVARLRSLAEDDSLREEMGRRAGKAASNHGLHRLKEGLRVAYGLGSGAARARW
jgi:1,2-diacylglycerol-3-alpha-glucose alpha-1,2-galactosyltransferase